VGPIFLIAKTTDHITAQLRLSQARPCRASRET
jgi:hypothetical protein